MRVRAPYHPCGCRAVGECFHINGPTRSEDKSALTRLSRAFGEEMRRVMHEQVDAGNGGWSNEEWTVDEIKAALIAHVEKGDPVDVANFAAFWWNRLGGDKRSSGSGVYGCGYPCRAGCGETT